jgi:hypothetical protein
MEPVPVRVPSEINSPMNGTTISTRLPQTCFKTGLYFVFGLPFLGEGPASKFTTKILRRGLTLFLYTSNGV